MNTEPKHKLTIFSKELNDILNVFHEESKRYEKISTKLILTNSIIYLWRKGKKLFSLKGVTGLIIVVVPGWLISKTTKAFQNIIELPSSSLFFLSILGILLSGSFVRVLVLNEMSTVGSELFHLGVYEKRKNKEYSSLISMSKEKDFVLTLREELEKELGKEFDKQLLIELEKKKEIIEYKNLIIEEKNEAIEDLLTQLDFTEESAYLFKEKYDILIDTLYQLKSKLNLLVNDQFNLDNIDFGSSYSLYKIEEDGLLFIGAYGINKAELDVFIPYKKGNNKYIQSMDKSQNNPLIQTDFISWKRILQDGSEWILSLHLDDSNNTKLKFDDETGKLNLTITQELLWICCELLNKFTVTQKEIQKGED
ncbi:hypothetical protein [Halalkalibacter alkalisediminis]|uniref:hypothetical protein n=1 Tax=Halalkalibacter alkalisediminis TaxID=935616 RepID=UPI00235F83FE|nr:hypothetical protein [Halalkalibacter alkalisediminis]